MVPVEFHNNGAKFARSSILRQKNRIIVFIYTHSKIIIACLSLKEKIKSLDLIPFAHRPNEKNNCI